MNQFPSKNYFTLPNEIFSLGLGAGEIAVYTYLRCLENPSTYQCWPSYSTIGHHDWQCRWPRKEYGHAVCRRALGERTHLHRANLCPDKIQDQKERQSALYHQAHP